MTTAELKHQAALVEWRERIAECRSSGMSVKAWCGMQEIRCSTYYRWEREIFGKVQKRACEAEQLAVQPSFVPVRVEKVADEQPRIAASIRIGSACVDIYSGADVRLAEALCRGLMKC